MMFVFAQSGMVTGGWGYVVTCYVATWVFISIYAISLWVRSREER